VQKILHYFTKSILSGLVIVLPFGFLWWIWGVISGTIEPFTGFVLSYITLPEEIASFVAFVILLSLLFLIGKFVQTTIGRFVHENLEKWLLRRIPFYETFREILSLWRDKRIFQSFALAQLNENSDELVPCFVADENPISGTVTILHVTSPNPTTGFPRIVPKERVYKIDELSTKEKWNIIISCGSGTSNPIIDKQIKRAYQHIKKSA